jgi:hypothetical protein
MIFYLRLCLVLLLLFVYSATGAWTPGQPVAAPKLQSVLDVRAGARKGSALSSRGESHHPPATAVEVITLGDNKGLLIRSKRVISSSSRAVAGEEEFFIATTERNASGNLTLHLVPASASASASSSDVGARRAGMLREAVRSLKHGNSNSRGEGASSLAAFECDGIYGVYVYCSMFFLLFLLIVMSLSLAYRSIAPCLHSLTPRDV